MQPRAILPLLAFACCAVSACAPLHRSGRPLASRLAFAGGYSVSDNTRESSSIAAFAAREESRRTGSPIRVVKVLKAEKQVVAGTNFRLRVAAQRNGATTETADVVVYRDLRDHRHLTSWRWVKR